MKKLVSLLILCALLTAPALAEIDLSGMTFEELVDLRAQVDLAIFASDGWQEVTVPAGAYVIGRDIPAGYWTIAPVSGAWADVTWGSRFDASGTDIDWDNKYASEIILSSTASIYRTGDIESVSWELKEGTVLLIEHASVVFTPFAGHNLGFK